MREIGDKGKIIYFFDEARFGLQPTFTRLWALRGKPCVVEYQQSYQWCYVYSAIAPANGDSFSLILPEVNTEMMNLFLTHLHKHIGERKIVLVMDRAGWHCSKKLKIAPQIELIYMPPYSPELNPVERLWKWIRSEVTHNRIFSSLDSLINDLAETWKALTVPKIKRLCHCEYI